MARTLKSYRLYLIEDFQKKILEIGQRVKPLQTDFEFLNTFQGYEARFSDMYGNKILVNFYKTESKVSAYEIDFSVNGTSFGDKKKMTLDAFFPIISTVVSCTNDFIKKINPACLYIAASDKKGKEGQKQNIWKEYVLQNITDTGFVLSIDPNVIALQNNHHPDIVSIKR